jgi:hypothetical protein
MEVTRVFELLDADPFVPFDVDLNNGRRIEVSHPENVVIFPNRQKVREILVYYPERDDYSIIWPLGITALHIARRPEGPEW